MAQSDGRDPKIVVAHAKLAEGVMSALALVSGVEPGEQSRL